ncbi:glutathione S-transferase family protein [Sphingobium algorifonticola]|uniref:Glutathione S-transferase family protein n=1 Tax=Sphingobium algorifonticola TaxID=2008318 RepID=A0A437J8W3_9SPHN|nr:glutathione S-transferase family protein [Sphingobium algorifonticola]RVT41937.1 glutathione S-transferase family protein [Sphingobium algorifonticola]
MIEIYHKPITRSIRVVWLCNELGLSYRLVFVDEGADKADLDAFDRDSVLRKVPTVSIDGLVMTESGAIVQQLLEAHEDSLVNRKPGTAERAAFLQWIHGAETLSFATSLVAQHAHLRPENKRVPAMAAEGRQLAFQYFSALEKELFHRAYIVGERFSAADIMVGYTLYIAHLMELFDAQSFPKLTQYFVRITGRDAFKITIEQCVPEDVRSFRPL